MTFTERETERTRIFPLGENSLTIELGNLISKMLNQKVLRLSRYLEENPFPGLIETVPAYASLTVFYDAKVVKHNFTDFPTAFAAVKQLVENALRHLPDGEKRRGQTIEIPVSFAKQAALDLEFVAATNHLTAAEVIAIFTAKTYRVYMLGFLPGFAYLGEIDARIAAPRRATPRMEVPRGSVGIAGRQTGVYPSASPGGWQIIGQTAAMMFTPEADSPTLLRAGDLVKFYAI